MKKIFGLVLLTSLLLSSVAFALTPNTWFSGDLQGELNSRIRDSKIEFGSWNKMPLAFLQITNGKTLDGHDISDGTHITTTIDAGDYWVNGQITIPRLKIGETKQLTAMDMNFIEKYKEPTSIWVYRINDANIDDSRITITRLSLKEYRIDSDGALLYTGKIVRYPEGGIDIVYGDVAWAFSILAQL